MKLEDKECLKIKYDTQPAQINANTLLVSLLNFVALVEEINEVVAPEQRLQIRINAFEPGSFSVYVEVLKKTGNKLRGLWKTAGDSVKTVKNIIEIFKQFLVLKKHLAGEKPTEVKEIDGNNLQIKNSNGNTLIVNKNTYNIYVNDAKANDCLKNAFEPIVEDTAINGVEIGDRQPFLTIEKDDLPRMVAQNPLLEEKRFSEIVKNITVTVLKVVFQKNRKWEFVYNGQKISAYILDEPFYNQVINGQIRFGSGDKLIVDMEIVKVFDAKINDYLIKEYRIIRVKKYKPMPVQGKLF